MLPAGVSEQLELLIDELILDGNLDSASLASILVAAHDAVHGDYHATLSRRVWAAHHQLLAERLTDDDFERPATRRCTDLA
jgi:hypothetical protein